MPTINVAGFSLNVVTVTGTFYDVGSGSFATGNVVFQMTDFLWSVPTTLCGITGSIGSPLNSQGAFSVNLLAMDNANVSSQWFWKFSGTIAGIVYPPRLLKVYFALGATQNISVLLDMALMAL